MPFEEKVFAGLDSVRDLYALAGESLCGRNEFGAERRLTESQREKSDKRSRESEIGEASAHFRARIILHLVFRRWAFDLASLTKKKLVWKLGYSGDVIQISYNLPTTYSQQSE